MRVSRGDSGVFCWGKDIYQAFSCIRLGEILTSPPVMGWQRVIWSPRVGIFWRYPEVGPNLMLAETLIKCRGWIFYIVYGCQGWQDDKKSTLATRMLQKANPSPHLSHPGSHPWNRLISRSQTVAVAQEIATGKYTNPLIPRWDFGKVEKSPPKFSWKRNNWGVFWGCDVDVSICSPDKIQIDTTYIEKTGSLKGIFWQ